MQLFSQAFQELVPATAGLPNFVFFHEIHGFIDDELIHEYLPNLGQRVLRVLGGAGVLVLTLWIMVQGVRIVTGQSRESMMTLVVNALRATFIVGIALGLGAGFGPIYATVTDGLSRTINETMTGDPDAEGAYANVDRSWPSSRPHSWWWTRWMADTTWKRASKGPVDGDDHRRPRLPRSPRRGCDHAQQFAIGLVLALGPIFILCLLFEPTKALFHRWLLYGIGAIFSMAVLTVTVTLALDMVIAVGTAFWVSSLFGLGGDGESVTSMAMQQGGLGLILTTLIVSTPPIAAMLFQGTLGQFSPYSAFQPQPAPGSPGTRAGPWRCVDRA